MAFPAGREGMLEDAERLLWRFADETGAEVHRRRAEIKRCVTRHGYYEMTTEELEFAARVAWRNSARCIGRRLWSSLVVRDMRHLDSAQDIFEACVEHLAMATNRGKVRPVTTVFAPRKPGRPGVRIWNHQLIRYAGYRRPDGSVIGDPHSLELTAQAQRLGWKGRGGMFDVLPLIIQVPGREPELFELPEDAVLEVPLSHPDYPWFSGLGLKWYAVPAVSDMMLEAGGLQYPAAPFNGWYLSTEIGSRNLGSEGRYNLLPEMARKMRLDMHSRYSLWRDRALVELNVAVLYSYAKHGVVVVDHHTASKDFLRFAAQEERAGRVPRTDWSWVVPPMSSAGCPVFHGDLEPDIGGPSYSHQAKPWAAAQPGRADLHLAAPLRQIAQ